VVSIGLRGALPVAIDAGLDVEPINNALSKFDSRFFAAQQHFSDRNLMGRWINWMLEGRKIRKPVVLCA